MGKGGLGGIRVMVVDTVAELLGALTRGLMQAGSGSPDHHHPSTHDTTHNPPRPLRVAVCQEGGGLELHLARHLAHDVAQDVAALLHDLLMFQGGRVGVAGWGCQVWTEDSSK